LDWRRARRHSHRRRSGGPGEHDPRPAASRQGAGRGYQETEQGGEREDREDQHHHAVEQRQCSLLPAEVKRDGVDDRRGGLVERERQQPRYRLAKPLVSHLGVRQRGDQRQRPNEQHQHPAADEHQHDLYDRPQERQQPEHDRDHRGRGGRGQAGGEPSGLSGDAEQLREVG
jgi:hypothetical protein